MKNKIAREYIDIKLSMKPYYLRDPEEDEKIEKMHELESKYEAINAFEEVLKEVEV